MGLDLLGTLDIEEVVHDAGHAVDVLLLHHLFVLDHLLNESEVAADPAYFGVDPHVPVHLEDAVPVGFHSHVEEEGVPGFQFLAKPVEEPVVRVQFACLFVLDANEQVDIQ
jgi:hypothetical protein